MSPFASEASSPEPMSEADDSAPSAAVIAALQERAELVALEEQLYGHVIECIDFDALFGLEQMLWSLVDRLGLGHLDLEDELSKWMIRRAILRAAHDPNTAISDVPFGITKAEAKAANFDEQCPFCRYEQAVRTAAPAGASADIDDCCPLCDDMAREWRERHADALRRHGLA